MKRILFLVALVFLSSLPLVSAGLDTYVGFPGSVQDVNTNISVKSADLTLNISIQNSCKIGVIYTETFVDGVEAGVFSVLAGVTSGLNLNYNQDYWSCININNGSIAETFGPDIFRGGQGLIGPEDVNLSQSFAPFNVTVVTGTLDAGNITSVQFYEDDDTLNISEVGGAGPLTVMINWTNVTDFDSLISRHWYSGGQGHDIVLEIFRFTDNSWEILLDITDMNGFNPVVIFVADSTNHIGSNGNVSIRYRHIQNGISSHDFFIDFVSLVNGFTTITSANHDSLGGRVDKENHPWAFPIDASRDITKDTTFLEGLNISDKNVSMWQDETGFHIQTYSGASNHGDIILDPQGQDLHTDNIVPLTNADKQLGTSTTNWLGIWLRNIWFSDTNTVIWEDASHNLTFKDAIAGTWTLLQLSKSGSWIGTATSNLNMMEYNITNVSYVGIGLSNPLQPLHVNSSVVLFENLNAGSTDVRIQTLANSDRLLTFREGTTKQWEIRSDNYLNPLLEPLVFNSDGANNVLILHQGGGISINTTSKTNTVNIGGDLNATEIIYTNSTERVCTSENGLCNQSTKEFFVPIVYGTGTEGTTGDFYRWTLTASTGTSAFTNFYAPQDMDSVTNCVVIVIVGGAGGGLQINPTVNIDFAAIGETYNTHSTSVGGISIPLLTAGDLVETPCDATGMNAGDYVGVQILESGGVPDSDFHVIGVRLEYN